MSEKDDIKALLIEIRDNQIESLQRQQEHLSIAREQLERANKQVTESIALQKLAITRARQVARVAVPAIFLCLGLIVYLIVSYF